MIIVIINTTLKKNVDPKKQLRHIDLAFCYNYLRILRVVEIAKWFKLWNSASTFWKSATSVTWHNISLSYSVLLTIASLCATHSFLNWQNFFVDDSFLEFAVIYTNWEWTKSRTSHYYLPWAVLFIQIHSFEGKIAHPTLF